MFEKYDFVFSDRKPRLLITGAVHGNEDCGTQAINHLIKAINQSEIAINNGAITLIPVVNSRAYKQNIRCIDADLNRLMSKDIKGNGYEYELAPYLMKEIESCDYLLDLHSFSGDGPAFIFQDYNTASTIAWANALSIEYVLEGWPDLSKKQYHVNDTASYANAHGKTVLTVECGQHNDPLSAMTAYDVILDTLAALGLTAGAQKNTPKKRIRVQDVVLKNTNGKMAKNWKNFESFSEGEIIATGTSNDSLSAAYDGCIIMPNAKADDGEEWFYTGKVA